MSSLATVQFWADVCPTVAPLTRTVPMYIWSHETVSFHLLIRGWSDNATTFTLMYRTVEKSTTPRCVVAVFSTFPHTILQIVALLRC